MNLQQAFDEGFEAVKAYIDDFEQRIEKRLAVLESSGSKSLIDAYQGVYRDDQSYQRGHLVTHSGGLWFCYADTETRPGDGSHWVLAVKSGGK
jgi:hypothetical protein